MDLPIICTLTEAELQERRRTILAGVRSAVLKIVPLNDGYVFEFASSPQMLERLGYLVGLESQCCRFLNFKIVVDAGSERARLEVTGAPEAKTMIADFFGSEGHEEVRWYVRLFACLLSS